MIRKDGCSFVLNVEILSSVQMFEAQEDGAVVEEELAVILKTALGIGDFAVSDLFRAIDCQDKGKLTFGRSIYVDLHVNYNLAVCWNCKLKISIRKLYLAYLLLCKCALCLWQMIFASFWRIVLILRSSTTVSVSRSLNPPEKPHHPQSLSLQLTASVLTSALEIPTLTTLHTARNRTKSSFYYHSLSPSVCEGVCVCMCVLLCAGEVMTDHILKLNWDLHLGTLPQGLF